MALYLGNEKIKLYLNNELYYLNLISEFPIINGTILLSLEGLYLKDINGLYLTIKEDE